MVAACGVTEQERTTGGAAAGAATGAGVGALGGPAGVLAGAAIGAGAGAVTGAVTEPSTVNLGAPPWSNPQAVVPGFETERTPAAARGNALPRDPQIAELQRTLNQRGYTAGPVDGIYGPMTRDAIVAWQRSNNVPVTGRPTPEMMAQLGVIDPIGSRTGGQAGRGAAAGGGTGAMGTTGSVDRNPMTPPPGGGSQSNPFVNNNRNPGNEGTGNTGAGQGGTGTTQ
jgi:hypothetical protein